MGLRRATPILIAALALTGCGASAQEQFVSDADAICERVNREFGTHIERPDAFARMYPIVRQAQADLAAINAPAESRQAFARYLEVNQQRIDGLAAALKDPVTDVYTDPRMKRADVLQTRSGELAREVGFEQCA